ncbi:ABC transporter ATP-binding protein [Ochrobactrum teleogrylli]
MERLVLKNVCRNFGGLKAVADVSLSTMVGEIFGIIGPNGAGKTTLFNVIAGHFPPSSGEVFLEKAIISSLSPHEIARQGLGRSFQSPRLFMSDTVMANLQRASTFASISSPLGLLFRNANRIIESDVSEIASTIGLQNLLNVKAGSLSYGQQKVLGIGLAIATCPKILLMDEPAAGLNPTEKLAMMALISKLRQDKGIDILVIEHDMKLMMGVCDRIAVLNQGRLIAIGTPAEIQSNETVIEAYLGPQHVPS